MILSDFPPELLERVLWYLDKSSLSACCLAKSELLVAARSYLFRNLRIINHTVGNIVFLSSFPYFHLVSHIKINVALLTSHTSIPLFTKLAAQSHPPRVDILARNPMTSKFDGLRMVLKELPDFQPFITLRASVQLKRPNELHSLWPSDLNCILRDLRVEGTRASLSLFVKHTGSSILRTLRLNRMPTPWSTLEARFSCHQVEHMAMQSDIWLECNDATIKAAHNALYSASMTLKSFSLFLSPKFPTFKLDRQLPQLRSLLLWTSSYPFPFGSSRFIPTIEEFHQMAPLLEHICLYVHLNSLTWMVDSGLVGLDDWVSLVHLLTRLENVRHIEFYFYEASSDTQRGLYKDLEEDVRKLVYSTQWEGILTIVCGEHWEFNWPFFEF
ncbi:hypothetical protein DL96DRAFT_1609998 [Flagelloscypha sp. PMI_526]|nr:hypothetical protein DL96DRAFT_1609998 [Flagelloscypha sp. PMI_526]